MFAAMLIALAVLCAWSAIALVVALVTGEAIRNRDLRDTRCALAGSRPGA